MEAFSYFLFPDGFYYWIGVFVVGYLGYSGLSSLIGAVRVWLLDNSAILEPYLNTWAGEFIYSFLDASRPVSGMGCCGVPFHYAKLPRRSSGKIGFFFFPLLF
uniref:Uncharacterized protein n=1 Tax=Pseudonaja textilis TaxID=8673 RepID=A0A670YS27_PSETE